MVAVAHFEVGEVAPQRLDDTKVGVIGERWIAEHAVQDGDVLAARLLECTNGFVDLGKVGGSDTQHDRLALGPNMANEGQIGEVGRGDLVEVDHGLKVVGARVVEGGGGVVHSLGVRVVGKLAVLLLTEGVVLEEELVLRLRGLLGGVPVCWRVLRDDGARLVRLELRAVAAGHGGAVDVALGGLERRDALDVRGVVEVDAHLCDEVRGGAPHVTSSNLCAFV